MGSASVVIPSYNGRRLLKENLPSVIKAVKFYDSDSELVVVDDGSEDDSVRFMRKEFQSVRVIHLKCNRGFAVAANTGILSSTNRIVILLNNDVKVCKDFIAPLVAHFADGRTFAVGCKILLKGYDYEGNEGFNKMVFERGLLCVSRPEAKDSPNRCVQTCPIPYAAGAAMAVDRDKFRILEGFDPFFKPAYYEDADLSYRAWKRGWRVVYEPGSIVYHYHSRTFLPALGESTFEKTMTRNAYLFMWKNLTDTDLFVRHLLWLPRNLWAYLRAGRFALVKNIVGALPLLPLALKKRRGTKESAKVSDKALLELFG